jgi:hypothetical protein
MANRRINDFNQKFVYIETNPENIISAKKGAYFYRKGTEFFVNYSGNLDGKWEKLPYKTVIIPAPPRNKLYQYKQPQELWRKTTDGFIDEFKDLLPKTGWKFVSYANIFLGANPRRLNWVFPVPTNSFDAVGNNNSRSYDENYFYAKLDGIWYRTPITVWNQLSSQGDGPDRTDLTTNLPFVDAPRKKPLPINPDDISNAPLGEQTYDYEYFYIQVSKWKRTRLNIYYNTNKMTRF